MLGCQERSIIATLALLAGSATDKHARRRSSARPRAEQETSQRDRQEGRESAMEQMIAAIRARSK
jgi:hypothetical protein